MGVAKKGVGKVKTYLVLYQVATRNYDDSDQPHWNERMVFFKAESDEDAVVNKNQIISNARANYIGAKLLEFGEFQKIVETTTISTSRV